ncbi:MAG: hypothetical protein IPJ32_16545 [Sphingobacteriaceae bacterium]|nr:hypothetical protein [Sphingobacteriaceae bacterium]
MFVNCTGTKAEEKSISEAKKDSTSQSNSVYTNDCRTLYLDALKNDSIILLATEVNPEVGNKAVKAFADFAFYCPNDTLAPVFLLKAGQIARVLIIYHKLRFVLRNVTRIFLNLKTVVLLLKPMSKLLRSLKRKTLRRSNFPS